VALGIGGRLERRLDDLFLEADLPGIVEVLACRRQGASLGRSG
jgi:hypothetical protein